MTARDDALARPALSVVVVIASDTTAPRAGVEHLARCLGAFAEQVDAPDVELIVPCHDAVEGIEGLAERFPEVVFLPVAGPKGPSPTGDRVHHHTLRAAGLRAARGELLALVEDHARADPHWCANLVAAHRRESHAGIGGAIENGVDRALNHAVYLCDFAPYQNPVPEGESPIVSDINVAYRREALEAIRPAWEGGFYEVVVNAALRARGGTLALRRDVVMVQNRVGLRPGEALRERVSWARAYAGVRNHTLSPPRRIAYGLLSPLLPLLRTARIARSAAQRGHFGAFLRALPWIVLLEIGWGLGEGAGYLFGSDAGGVSG